MSHSPFPWSTHPQVPNAVFDADGRRINEAWSPPAEATAWLIHWGDVVPEFTRDIRQAERGRRCGCNVDEFYAASRPSPIDPETAADNAALIAAIPAMIEALENLQQRAGAVATWLNHWDVPFADQDEWRGPTGDGQLFFNALNKAAAVLASIGKKP